MFDKSIIPPRSMSPKGTKGTNATGESPVLSPVGSPLVKDKKLHVYVVDDCIGECGERMVTTVCGQWPNVDLVVEVCAHTRDPQMVKPIVQEVLKVGGIIIHTLVEEPIIEALMEEAQKYGVCH